MEDEKLCTLVESYKFLYDKRTAAFKNKVSREDAWEAISKELGAPVDVCMRRWNALRERFSKEVRRYVPSGSGNDNKNSWHLYDAMSFLKPFIAPRRTKGSTNILACVRPITPDDNGIVEELDFVVPSSPAPRINFKSIFSDASSDEINNTPPSSDPLSDDSINLDSEPSTSGKRKRKQSSVDQAMLEALQSFKKSCENQIARKNTAVESFSRMIAAIVSEMSSAKQTKTMRQVTDLVMSIKEEPE